MESTVWKFNGNLEGTWELETPLRGPMANHRSYVINDEIVHLSANGANRYSKFHVINRTIFIQVIKTTNLSYL